MSLLRLDDAPHDPIERIMWLTGVNAQVRQELDAALAEAYFKARLERRLDTAVKVGPYGKKRVLALTRRENERRGRAVRWADGADPTSTAYGSEVGDEQPVAP